MTIGIEEKKALSDLRIKKAKEFLEDARANHDERRYRTAVNRCYYSALNAVRSLLILEGINPESHEGSITMLSLKFVKPGLLHVDVVKKFKILLSRRTDVDYGDFDAVEAEDSDDSLRLTEWIIKMIEKARRELNVDGVGLS